MTNDSSKNTLKAALPRGLRDTRHSELDLIKNITSKIIPVYESYGFEELSIQGWSTDSEAGIREIQNLADEISKRKIKALFVETSISPATIEALEAAVQSRGHDIVIGGELFSDAIGEKGTPEGTYVGAFTHNVNTIVEALK